MRAILVSRYPRVDTPPRKRQVAADLLEQGIELGVLYSHSTLRDQAEAGIREFGGGAAKKLLALRRDSGSQVDPPRSLAAWAAEQRIPVHRFRRLGDPDCLARLRELAPDLLVLLGADIVPEAVLRIPARGTINAHYGLLPRYRGMSVTEWSIYHDDPVGVTVHAVDPGIDTGDILLQGRVRALHGDDLASLRVKHQELAARLLVDAARSVAEGSEERQPQRPEEGRQYYRMHALLRDAVERKLATGDYRWLAEASTRAPV